MLIVQSKNNEQILMLTSIQSDTQASLGSDAQLAWKCLIALSFGWFSGFSQVT